MREHTRIAQSPPAPSPDPAPDHDDGNTEVIQITETSAAHDTFVGRTPTTVLGRDDLTAAGHATLGDILQAIPAQTNAGNAQVNAGGDGTARVNLRGLGAARTLVLVNGRRLGNSGAGANSSVDINEIPLAMIERVEVAKDGAAAVYGAEAIGGVVNIITRPQYDGIDVSLLTSTSQRGDGVEYDASGVAGFTTSDKHTYAVLSAGYQHHDPVLGGDRVFSRYQDTYDFATRTVGHYLSPSLPGGRLDVTGLGVHPPGCTSTVCTRHDDGSWANVAPGDGYNEAADSYIYTPSTRANVYATAGNRINDDLNVFGEALWLWRTSSREFSPVSFQSRTINSLGETSNIPISKDSLDNPFGVDLTNYQRRMTELGPRTYDDTVSLIRFVTGVQGTVPDHGGFKDWRWEVSYNYSSADVRIDSAGQLDLYHLGDAIGPSMLDASGTRICVKTPGDASTKIIYTIRQVPVLMYPCVPTDLLATKISADQLKNVTYNDLAHGTNVLSMPSATAHGQLAALPNHGAITMSLGADYRRETGSQDPPSAASIPGYATGAEAHTTDSHFHVWEGFGELEAVPFADGDIIKRIELDLSARALHYTRYGSDATYKLGGLVHTVAGLTARASYATAYRAPSIAELIGGRTETFVAAEDPCDAAPPSTGAGKTLSDTAQARCAAQGVPTDTRFGTAVQNAFSTGNAQLRPESAQTATVGVVFEPAVVPGLAVSADYWHIAIDHAIETLSVQNIFANCYDRGIAAFCDQVQRDPISHEIIAVNQSLENVDQTRTSGLDVALWYDLRLPLDYGRVHAGLEGQYLFAYDVETASQTVHGAGYYDLGVYPHLRGNLSARWARINGASGGFSLRYVGGYQECAGNDCNLEQNRSDSHDVDHYFKLDVFGGYDLRTRAGLTSFQFGIDNVLDATPPVIYNAAAANSDATAYDFIGRMFYLRVSQQI